MEEKEDFFTIDVIAEKLGVKTDQIFTIFAYGINSPGPQLKPSVYLEQPILMVDVAKYKEECKANIIDPLDFKSSCVRMRGLFQIQDFGRIFNELIEKYGILNLMDIPLSRGNSIYLVQELVKVRSSDLVVAKIDFAQFMDQHGFIREKSTLIDTSDSIDVVDNNQIQKKKNNLPTRSSGVIFKPRDKVPITKILEHVFDSCENINQETIKPGNKNSLYKFIKTQVANKAKLPDGKNYAEYIEQIVIDGVGTGILMYAKEGKNTGSKKDRFYSAADISQRLSIIRKARKEQK